MGILREEWPVVPASATDTSLGSSLQIFRSLSPLQEKKGKTNKQKWFHIYASITSSLISNSATQVGRKRRRSHCRSAAFIEHSTCKYSTTLEASVSNRKQAA